MRVPVQRHLILWLCLSLFSLPASAAWVAQTTGCTYSNDRAACQTQMENWVNTRETAAYARFVWEEGHIYQGRWYGYQWDDANTTPSGVDCSTNVCNDAVPAPCESPNFIDPDTGECRAPDQPEQCYEQGELYDAEYGRCVHNCPEGQLNGVCLQTTGQNNDTCNGDSPDYKGYVDFGAEKKNLCQSQMECDGGSFGVVNGIPACIPDEYGPPTCSKDAVIVIDEYGFVCDNPEGQPAEEPPAPEDPNTDTDGDGTPDEYQRKNDPESVDKGLDNINEGIGNTNTKLDGANDRLDKLSKGIEGVNDNLNEGLGTANQTLGQIRDKMDGPDGGYNTDGLGDAPTFETTSTRLQDLIRQNPTIQAVTTIPSIAQNNTCPVWTIPATDFWDATPMDIHCDILNQYRGLFSALFMAVWTLAAVFVFLRA